MGLLDNFNIDDPRTMGLLNAGFSMMGNSGASRTPVNLGQILSGGLQAYAGTQDEFRKRKQQEAELAQMEKYRGLQMQQNQMQVDQLRQQIKDQEAAKQRAAQLPELVRQFGNDYQGMIRAGVPVDYVKSLAESQNYGKSKVSRVEDIGGEKGEKLRQMFDEYGNPVGSAMAGYIAPEKIDLGDRVEFNLPKIGDKYIKGLSPSDREIKSRFNAGQNPELGGGIPDPTLKMMAQQYLAGDTSVMQNLGRGAQGSKNIIALRSEIQRQANEMGLGGSDLAAKNAEYFGLKAAQRTVGTKSANTELAANEASQLIPLARQASDAVSRSGFLPFGKAQIMFNEQTNDPALRQFAAANNSLVNVYARAISPTGVGTVSDKEHAREMLRTAYDQASYNATLEQMQKEIDAAIRAPKQVRDEFSRAVSGREEKKAETTQNTGGWSIKRVN